MQQRRRGETSGTPQYVIEVRFCDRDIRMTPRLHNPALLRLFSGVGEGGRRVAGTAPHAKREGYIERFFRKRKARAAELTNKGSNTSYCTRKRLQYVDKMDTFSSEEPGQGVVPGFGTTNTGNSRQPSSLLTLIDHPQGHPAFPPASVCAFIRSRRSDFGLKVTKGGSK